MMNDFLQIKIENTLMFWMLWCQDVKKEFGRKAERLEKEQSFEQANESSRYFVAGQRRTK